MRTGKNESQSLRKWLETVKGVAPGNMVRVDLTYGWIWQLMGRKDRFDTRQDWLVLTSWDPAWVFHNWDQLPQDLKLELCKIPLAKIEEMAKTAPREDY